MRTDSLTVRRAGPADIPTAAQLALALMRHAGFPISADSLLLLEEEIRAEILAGTTRVFLAFSGSRPVGAFHLKRSQTAEGVRYEAWRLWVEPEERHGRVGWKLLQAALESVPEEDAVVLITTQGELPRSYRGLGFRPLFQVSGAAVANVRAAMRRGSEL